MRLRNKYLSTDPFTDLLFNALLGFTFLFLAAMMFINPKAKSGIIDPKAEYIITIRWEDNSSEDIDLWVEDPYGSIIWFRNREVGLTHLDRDDRGMLNDVIVINETEEIVNPLNQEVVTIRGTVPGEYVVNVHYYQSQDKNNSVPVNVYVRLDKVNPKLKVLYYDSIRLEHVGVEKTAFRFKIKSDGEVASIGFLPKKIVILGKQAQEL